MDFLNLIAIKHQHTKRGGFLVAAFFGAGATGDFGAGLLAAAAANEAQLLILAFKCYNGMTGPTANLYSMSLPFWGGQSQLSIKCVSSNNTIVLR
jgi:hypothetical protein